MAMPQRDDTIEAIKRLDALLEHAVMHGDEAEAERLREELRKLTDREMRLSASLTGSPCLIIRPSRGDRPAGARMNIKVSAKSEDGNDKNG